MTPARIEIPDRLHGSVAVNVSVQDVEGGIVRVLSARPLPERCDATLAAPTTAGAAPVAVRVTQCRRLITGCTRCRLP